MNIIDAYKRVVSEAEEGDCIFLHYSGESAPCLYTRNLVVRASEDDLTRRACVFPAQGTAPSSPTTTTTRKLMGTTRRWCPGEFLA